MAISEAGSSSDAALALEDEYDVFLNFRGEDTRHNFTDFLYDHLADAGVLVFRDEEKLPIGEEIGDNLLRAINNCKLYIPIFSRTYASSKWCLRELALMVDNVSHSGGHKSILPIFFDVEPEDLKLRTPLYEAAFLEHEKKFPDKVDSWKKALAKVDETKGWIVKKNQSQAAIVKLVVGEVLEKLKIKQKSVTEHLVGLDDRVKDLIELLDIDYPDVRLIGIYGMGGIGKTTIAKIVFNQLCSHFGKCCSFLDNIRESSSTKVGIVQLQKRLLSDIGGSRFVGEINDSEEGMRRVGATLRNKKVMVVLDDVDKKVPTNVLIGNSKLYRGSRIIITTRDRDTLQVEGFDIKLEQYEMQTLDDGHALQLFCRHAFRKNFCSDDYSELSRKIISLMGGLPLAIEVVGSLLKNKEDRKFWEETLVKLKEVPKEEILEKLRISYDDLDEFQKKIFLDIACFCFNEKKTDAIYMWESCKFYPIQGIEVLTKRCLIKILDNDKLWMHDQLIALGRQIVREDSPDDLGKQSRLWIAEEAIQIVKTEETKDKVQALQVYGVGVADRITITNKECEKLPNLRFLDLNGGTYIGDFARCLSNLRWLRWHSPIVDYFRADNIYLDRLVVCKLHWNVFEDDSKAWDLIKRAQNLKVLSITECHGITIIPDISKCLDLERLTLAKCLRLKRIESFIGNLQSLIELKIEECWNFTDLPEEVGALVKLEHFSLSGCRKLRELPGSIGDLTSLVELDLTDMTVSEFPNFIGKLKSLRILRFPIKSFVKWESYNWWLPSCIGTLVNLEELDISGHNEIDEIPVEIGELSSLRILNLGRTCISEIPRTIKKLQHLQTLNLWDCNAIQLLPELPTSLTRLHFKSKSMLSLPNLSNLTNLVDLQLSGGCYLTKKSNTITRCNLSSIGRSSRLKKLELNLLDVPEPPELASLPVMEELLLRRLDQKPVVQLPSSNSRLRNLSSLEIKCCEVEDIPLEGLPRLEIFTVQVCSRLQRLSIPLELRKLRRVHVSKCPDLGEIQIMGLSKSVEYWSVDECKSLIIISGLSYLKNLETLRIERCYVLTNVEGLDELESLKSLVVRSCKSLRWLIDAYCTKIPDDCVIDIMCCGDSIKNSRSMLGMPLKRYREEILQNTSNKISFAIQFHLGVKKSSEGFGFVGGIKRESGEVTPDSVTYEGLITDVKNFGFRLRRMWYESPGVYNELLLEMQSDEQVKRMVQLASERGLIHLYVEGGVDSDWEGEYDDEMIEMLTEEWGTKTDDYSNENGANWDVSRLDEDSDSASACESETHGTSSVDDFQSESGNAEYFEATGILAEKDLDGAKKHMELQEEPKDEESAGDVTISTISSNSLATCVFFETKTVSEVSTWSAEVDELERLLKANVKMDDLGAIE